jgi:Ras-related GTP-binding protein A/B
MGNLVLNLWDCGGQYRFYESYFDSKRDTIFRNVEVLIYVLDIESAELESDFTLFDGVIEAMEQHSPDASVFVLIHKMDLVPEDERVQAFAVREAQVKARSQQ